ncbi:HEAT repeat domain-containing protein [Clostridium sp.]|uniref:HEAT repeat domain-containing protein n=1 Tax=Clostridium sp. TaxID=1506 RepID=UPI002FCB6DC6
MSSGLVKYNWDFIENHSEEEITYFLHLEGKSIEAISKIRNLEKSTVQKHLINCKIKYRYLVKSESIDELFQSLAKADKSERIYVLNSLDRVNKEKLKDFIKKNYIDLTLRDKESALWIIGELRIEECIDILIKSTVNNHVNIRRLSVSALGKIAHEKGEIALVRALNDSNSQVVSYAIKSLQKLNSKRAIDKIKEIHISSDKPYIQKACEDYLAAVK